MAWHPGQQAVRHDDREFDDSESTGNPIGHAILVALGAVIWLVIQAGRAVLIVLAVLIAVTLSLADLVLQLLVMPFVLPRPGRLA